MDLDALVREVMDMRKTLDAAVRDIEFFMRHPAFIVTDTTVSMPPAPFAPTLEDFATFELPEFEWSDEPRYSTKADSALARKLAKTAPIFGRRNNDGDNDGA
jgi:hypothetical protein